MGDKIRYIALDQATVDCGFCVVEVDGDDFKILESGMNHTPSSKPLAKRNYEKIKFIQSLVDKYNLRQIYYEEVHLGGGYSKATSALNKLIGVIEVFCDQNGYYYQKLNVNNWKRIVGIKSRTRDLQKKEGIAIVKELFGIECKTDDESDAILIGIATFKKGLYHTGVEYLKKIEDKKIKEMKKSEAIKKVKGKVKVKKAVRK